MPADFEGDVPSLGVARALMVILVIHVVAIAGIFFHSRWLDKGDEVSAAASAGTNAEPEKTMPLVVDETNLPKLKAGEDASIYTVGTGETYESIAGRFGLSEEELRMANDNIPIRQGRYLKIPPKMIRAVESAELAELRNGGVRTAAAVETASSRLDDGMISTDAAMAADQIPIQAAGPRGPVATDAGSVGGGSYVVKSGDTFWSISKAHGVSVDSLMKANHLTDPKKLKLGLKLVIPR